MNAISSTAVSLDTLSPGACGTIAALGGTANNDMVDRLREIGFAEGLDVEFLHQSPFGKDPIAVRVGDMTVALRRAEATLIKVNIV
ncbi:MAG: ferrous iron transport protein A [Kordiimonadaceae bacterium]|nr:ferrous iron transport protein A [Kordiimonadaceae bacterium]